MWAVLSLTDKNYKASPLRRVYIDKKNKKRTPSWIPTMYDRAMQALYALALDPVAETAADPALSDSERDGAVRMPVNIFLRT